MVPQTMGVHFQGPEVKSIRILCHLQESPLSSEKGTLVDDLASLAQIILDIYDCLFLWLTEIPFKDVSHIKVKFEFLNRTGKRNNSANNNRRGYSEGNCMRWKSDKSRFFRTV